MVEGVKAGGMDGPTGLLGNGSKTPVDRFAIGDGPAPPDRNPRLTSTQVIGLESMLALQAVDEAVERDRAARNRGMAAILALTRLQRAMLANQDPASALEALNELTSDGLAAEEPGLGTILRAIVLRSRIEIARRAARADG